MEEFKKQWLPRAFIGGCVGIAGCLLLGFLTQPGAVFGGTLTWDIRNFTFCYDSRVPELLGTVQAFLLWFLFGAEIGIATLPFADSGRELVVRSLAHFAVMSLTVDLWAAVNFGVRELPFFLIPLALVYALVWLGRWVGWYAEVAAIREKLGLAPGPSLFHWKESLPYVGFAFLLCLVLPTVLRLLDDPTPLLSVFYAFVLLPVGGVMSGLSLGRRHGFCPLYPVACGAFIVVFILTAKLYTNMADGAMIPIAFVAALAGNLAGAAQYKLKQRKGAGAT